MGGLGNQMFQYAAGRALSLRLNTELKLDNSWFSSAGSDTSRAFMLQCFPIVIREASLDEVNRTIFKKQSILQKILGKKKKHSASYKAQPSFDFWPDFGSFGSPVYLFGYWQNERYFSGISSTIKQDFTFPAFSSSRAKDICQRIKTSSCSISIHIRRGDYVENPDTNRFHGVCSLEYYEKALRMITGKYNIPPELFLFSDDPAWARNNFNTYGYPSVIVDIPQHKDAPYNDMHLMSLCQHHIIANSSFSWWAAWLSCGDGMVIAPKRWFAEETIQQYNPSPSSWITI